MQQIILASQSPRRNELLSKMDLKFDIVPSKFDEKLDDSRSAAEVAKELSIGKAMVVAQKYPDSVVIGSDSIVFLNSKQFGKPENSDKAREMIRELSGKTHGVVTGVAVVRLQDNVQIIDSETALVHLKPYDWKAVEDYVNTYDVLDMAGAYGIQAGAAPLVEFVEGDFDTIIGLPTKLLSKMLKKLGIDSEPVTIDLPMKRR